MALPRELLAPSWFRYFSKVISSYNYFVTFHTFAALHPVGVFTRSNCTSSFSVRVRYPELLISEKCTKQSGPFSWAMKPYPFAASNVLTLPKFIYPSFPSVVIFSLEEEGRTSPSGVRTFGYVLTLSPHSRSAR